MCTGIEIAALAASAAGTAYSVNSAENAADERQSIINAAAEEDARLNSKKADKVEDFAADTFDPNKRAERQEQAITKQEDSLVDALTKAGGSELNKSTQGNLSEDYVRARATSTAGAATDIMERARLAARNSGASLLFGDEALKGGQLSSDIAGINSQSNRNAGYARNAVNGVRDQGSLVGGLLQGAGSAAANYKKAT